MTRDHDTGYKRLFGHPERVRDLLQDWVPGEWLADGKLPPILPLVLCNGMVATRAVARPARRRSKTPRASTRAPLRGVAAGGGRTSDARRRERTRDLERRRAGRSDAEIHMSYIFIWI